jgi:transcriptional regulator with XRE-family HTH domain
MLANGNGREWHMALKLVREAEESVGRIRTKMKQWGITATFLAAQLGVSRQYAWQIIHYRTFLSVERAREIEHAVDAIIAQQKHVRTVGDRLRAARVSAGLTLKEVARAIGYTWVGVERWEKNVCRPKPSVLWHLLTLYGVAGTWPGMDSLSPIREQERILGYQTPVHVKLAEALRGDVEISRRAS